MSNSKTIDLPLFLGASSLISVTLFLFGPLEILLTQSGEFYFGASDVLGWLVAITCVSIAVCFSILSICSKLGRVIRTVSIALFFIIGLLFYIQGNWTHVDYGIMDGSAIDWGKYRNQALVNGLLWALPVALGLFMVLWRKTIPRQLCLSFSYGVVALEMLSLALLMLGRPSKTDSPSVHRHCVTANGQFELSKNKDNILVVCADGFDARLFLPVLKEEPALLPSFDGFTFFPDAAGTSLYSEESAITLLSGRQFHTMMSPFSQNVHLAYSSSRFFKKLAENNYKTSIYLHKPRMIDDEITPMIANVQSAVEENKPVLVKNIYKMVLFRYMPHSLKKLFWYTTMDFDASRKNSYVWDNLSFSGKLRNAGITSLETPCNIYHFYWIQGPHQPVTIDRDCKPLAKIVSMKDHRFASMQFEQTIGVVRLFSELLQSLRRSGVYDNTAVVFAADHGWEVRPNPLLLVKPRNAHGELRVSKAPISMIEDWEATFMSFVDPGNAQGGRTIFDVAEGEERLRKVYVYGIQNGVDRKYTCLYADYYAAGAFLSEKPRPVKEELVESARQTIYRAGTPVTLSGNEGFALNQSDGCWTIDNEAKVELQLEGKIKDCFLEMEYSTYSRNQPVSIFANDTPIADYVANGKESRRFFIPGSSIGKDGKLTLRFEFPKAVSPDDLKHNGDKRKLALRFQLMRICDAGKLPRQETTLSFAGKEGAPARKLCFKGIGKQENNHTWTIDDELEIRLSAISLGSTPQSVTLRYGTFLPKERVVVSANGHELANYVAKGDEKRRFAIPPDCFSEDGTVTLTFSLPDAASPKDVGLGNDDRKLALKLYSLQIK